MNDGATSLVPSMGTWSTAIWPVLLAQSLQGFAGCMLSPSLTALTPDLVSATAVERLRRNARAACRAPGAASEEKCVCGASPNCSRSAARYACA